MRNHQADSQWKTWSGGFRERIDVDLVGPFIVSKHVGKKWSSGKIRVKIINICLNDEWDWAGNTVSAYAAAKGGLKNAHTKIWPQNGAKHNIQGKRIRPLVFCGQSKLSRSELDGHPFNDLFLNRTPSGRWGDPKIFMAVAAFSLSSTCQRFRQWTNNICRWLVY